MGVVRAVFVRVFFGVFNVLSVIAQSIVHVTTSMALRLKNVLMHDLTPKFAHDPKVSMTPKFLSWKIMTKVMGKARRIELVTIVLLWGFVSSPVFSGTFHATIKYKTEWTSSDNGHANDNLFDTADAACVAALSLWENYYSPYTKGTFTRSNANGGQCLCTKTSNLNSDTPTITYDYAYSSLVAVDVCSNGAVPHGVLENGEFFMVCDYPDLFATTHQKNLGPQCPAINNPITIGTANKILTETDFLGTGPFPLQITRTYNSQQAGTGQWRWSVGGFISSSGSTTSVYRTDGKVLTYTLTSSAWKPDADITDTLAQTTNPAGWTYTTADGTVETYSSDGRRTSFTNRAGLTQTYTLSNGTTSGYVLDTNGNATTTAIPVNWIISLADSTGRKLTFTYGYDANNIIRVTKITDPNGGVYLYTYDTNYNFTTVTHPDGSIRTYHYENATFKNALTGISDQKSVSDPKVRYATYSYDSQGRAYDETHAANADHYHLAYTTDTSGNPVSTVVTDPLNTARTYNFTTVLGVVKSTGTDQPGGSGCGPASSALTYDANGNIKTRTDFSGNTTWYDYDMARNLEITRIEAQGKPEARTITTTWHANYRLPLIITEPGRTTTNTYDSTSGNLLTKTLTDTTTNKTRTWTYTYTSAADNTLLNLLKTVDGPRTDVSDITTYTYYSADDATLPIPKYRRGDLWKITDALSHVTQITAYDGNGRPLTLIDPNTVPTTLTYTPRGWLKSKTVGSKTTAYDYDNVGQLTKVTLADGSFIQYTYDAAHRLTDISDAKLNRVHYTLDAIGNRVKEEVFDSNNKLSTVKARDFDALNRLYHDIAYFNDPNTPVATQYSYDANGNLTTVTPPANSSTDTTFRTTTFYYDALNRLAGIADPINGLVKATQYSYDTLDQLKSVTDPRTLATAYAVNALGDATQQVSPDSGATNRTFDEAGNVKTETYANSKYNTNYTYDALNRLISITYPATGATLTYIWDAATNCTYGIGRLCQMMASNGAVTTFAYDDQGNLTKVALQRAGMSFTTQYNFDGANRPAFQTLPSGRTETLGRNTAGQINTFTTNSTTLQKQITYDGTGQVTSQTLGNGVILKASYDLSGQSVTGRFNKHDGDINQDGVVNVVDILFATRISEGLMTPTQDQLDHADVAPAGNPDGKIDVRDVNRIIRKAEGLENF